MTFLAWRLLAALLNTVEHEPTEPEPRAHWYDDVAFNGFVSTAIVHNLQQHTTAAGANAARVFDSANDSFKVDVAQWVVQNEPLNGGEAGFRVDLAYGMTVPVALGNGVAALQQAYVAYLAPLPVHLRLEVGTFRSNIGTEIIESFDNYNAVYSRSLLFLGIAPLITGIRVDYTSTTQLRFLGWVVNGWTPNILDINEAKTVGGQALWTPMPPLSVGLSYQGGPEQAADNSHWRHLLDIVLRWQEDALSFTAEGLWGYEAEDGAAASMWWGILALARWQMGHGFALAARGEFYDNGNPVSQPFFTNLGAQVLEATLSPSITFSEQASLRLEGRYDHCLNGAQIFSQTEGSSNQQFTLAANLLFAF